MAVWFSSSTLAKHKELAHRKSDDEGDRNVLEESSKAVIRRTPKGEEGARDDDFELGPERSRICKEVGQPGEDTERDKGRTHRKRAIPRYFPASPTLGH
jgi:hypothetical protein